MAHLVGDLISGYHDFMDNKSDPRVNDWSMMSSPWPTFLICCFYAYFSKVLGPRLMENKKPFDLRNVLVIYNLIQTVFSSWIFYEYLQSGWLGHYSFRCQPVDYSTSPMAMRMARTCWWYYFSKFTEFFDTMFFILRKKNNQVSNLHVIHHGCMPMSVWLGMKFAPGGHSTFFALVNTFVHIVMYFYYMVTAMGPQYQKYLWWKKYLTSMQMIQFVMIMSHQFQLLFTECNYPKGFMVWIGLHGVLFLFLFSDFYKTSYSNGKGRRRENPGACMPIVEENKKTDANSNGVLKNGNGVMSNGNGVMLTKRSMANGNGVLSNGNGVISNGNGVISNGNGVLSNGNGVLSNGNGVLSNGNGVLSNGNGVLSNGNAVLSNGNGVASDYANEYANGYSNCYSHDVNNGYITNRTSSQRKSK